VFNLLHGFERKWAIFPQRFFLGGSLGDEETKKLLSGKHFLCLCYKQLNLFPFFKIKV
jgi:hypothetical protein